MKTDYEIQKDVMDELKWQPLLNSTEIGVAVKNGVVTLTGNVDTYAKKIAAEKAAKKVAGVKAVAEEIDVKYLSGAKKTDTEIAESILNSLKWNSSVNEEKIKIKVEDGWVTLEGDADWEFQKIKARNAIENLNGVRGITNLIQVKPKLTTKEVKQKIGLALHRSATVDADRITVESTGNKVILSGHVRSLAEKNDAEDAAWSAPGVTAVENNIDVVYEESLAY